MKNILQSLQKLKSEITSQHVKPIDVDNNIEVVRKEFNSAINSLHKKSEPKEDEVIVAVENSQNFINSKFKELKETVSKENKNIKNMMAK